MVDFQTKGELQRMKSFSALTMIFGSIAAWHYWGLHPALAVVLAFAGFIYWMHNTQ